MGCRENSDSAPPIPLCLARRDLVSTDGLPPRTMLPSIREETMYQCDGRGLLPCIYRDLPSCHRAVAPPVEREYGQEDSGHRACQTKPRRAVARG